MVHNCQFFNEDCTCGSKTYIPENTVDLIVTDPPYGINGDKLHSHYNRNENVVIEGYIEIPSSEYNEFSHEWIKEAERILKPGGSIYIISGYTNLYHILDALKKTDLKEINHIIWKYNFGVFTKKKYVSSHYHILYYEKSGSNRTFNVESRYGLSERNFEGRSLNYKDREDVWEIKREYRPGQLKNKNSLPIELLVKIIQYSSNENDLICDFFLGGFSTAKAAIGLNRRIIGFEKSESLFEANISDIRALKPGYLMDNLRKPKISCPENQGKYWSNNELSSLISRYNELREEGFPKNACINQLKEEFKRGYWGIEKALKKFNESK